MSELTHAKAVTFILSKNLTVSKEFYQHKLGLSFVLNDGFADVFDAGHAILRITEIPDYRASPHPALGWEVPDIVKAVKELMTAGVKMAVYEGYGQDDLGIWTAPSGGAKVAWFHDPDMNLLSLTQR
jgi:catechol 2,3-dioxygenase-like lactoylglutathione lyase family enzyme